MENDFIAYLLAQSEITDLLGNTGTTPPVKALHWGERPDNAGFPCITLMVVSDIPDYTQDARTGAREKRIQADLYGRTFSSTVALYEALTGVLEAIKHVSQGDSEFIRVYQDSLRDLPATDDAGGSIFRRSIDFFVWHKTA